MVDTLGLISTGLDIHCSETNEAERMGFRDRVSYKYSSFRIVFLKTAKFRIFTYQYVLK